MLKNTWDSAYIGYYDDGSSGAFVGTMRDVCLYPSELTQEQITMLVTPLLPTNALYYPSGKILGWDASGGPVCTIGFEGAPAGTKTPYGLIPSHGLPAGRYIKNKQDGDTALLLTGENEYTMKHAIPDSNEIIPYSMFTHLTSYVAIRYQVRQMCYLICSCCIASMV